MIYIFRRSIDVESLRNDYLIDLMTKDEICKKHNLRVTQLNNILFEYGLTKTNGFIRKTGISKADLEKYYYDKTLSNTQICKVLDISEQTLRKLRKHYNLLNRYDYSEYNNAVCTMYLENKSTSMIARELNIPKSRVRKILLDCGVKLRNKSNAQIAVSHPRVNQSWFEYSDNLRKRCRRYFGNHISQKIKERDGYKCRDCGSDKNLHVHHKTSFSIVISTILSEHPGFDVVIDEDYLFNRIVNHPLFLDENNLITVCHTCHYLNHHPTFLYSKIISSQASSEEGSTTIPKGSTPQAIGGGSARALTESMI